MSMRPSGLDGIPAETVRVVRVAFPKGSLAIRIRDEPGSVQRRGVRGPVPVEGKACLVTGLHSAGAGAGVAVGGASPIATLVGSPSVDSPSVRLRTMGGKPPGCSSTQRATKSSA